MKKQCRTYSFIAGKAASAFDSLKEISKPILKTSNYFGTLGTGINAAQLVSEPTIENARNIAVDAISSNHPIVGLGLQSYFSVVDTIFSNQDSSPKSFDDEIMHFNSTGSLKW